MTNTEILPIVGEDHTQKAKTLFEEYNVQLVAFNERPIVLTEVGYEIFGAHLKSDKATTLANIFGDLIQHRISEPVNEPLVVVEFNTTSFSDDERWIAAQAVSRTVHYVGVEDCLWPQLEKHAYTGPEGEQSHMREVQLMNGSFVSTHFAGNTFKVLLTPESAVPRE